VDAILGEATLTLPVDAARAAELVEQALELNPSNPDAYLLKAKVELARNDLERALRASERAVELLPEDPEAHYTLGFVHLAHLELQRRKGDLLDTRRLESAIAAFERSAELHAEKDRWRPLVARAKLLEIWPEREGEVEGAFRAAVEAAKANANPAARVAAAEAVVVHARSSEKGDLRRWALEEIVAADDSEIEAWVELAAVSIDLGDSGKEVFQRLRAQRPRDARAHIAYAEFLVRNGDAEEATAHLERSIGEGADAPVILSALLELQYQRGRSGTRAEPWIASGGTRIIPPPARRGAPRSRGRAAPPRPRCERRSSLERASGPRSCSPWPSIASGTSRRRRLPSIMPSS
jgi:tetratricopeptide (TPR) repeat protein